MKIMKTLKILLSVLFILTFIGCEKENIIPTSNTNVNTNVNTNAIEYKNGVIIKNKYELSNSSVILGVSNPNTVILNPNITKLKSTNTDSTDSTDYNILVEGLDGVVNTIKTNGGNSITFSNPVAMLPINDKYVLIKGNNSTPVEIKITVPVYMDISILDSISIDSLSIDNTYVYQHSGSKNAQDTIRIYNIIDTITTSNGDMIKFYDTITYKFNHTIHKYFMNILYNINDDKYYDFNYSFDLNEKISSKNNIIYRNIDNSIFYVYSNESIIECDLSGTAPITRTRFTSNSNADEIGILYIINHNNIIFKSPSSKHFISVSENNKVDSIRFSDIPGCIDPYTIMNSNTALDVFLSVDNGTANVYSLTIASDTINISEGENKSSNIVDLNFDDRTNTYIFTNNNLTYLYLIGQEYISVYNSTDKTFNSYMIDGLTDDIDNNGDETKVVSIKDTLTNNIDHLIVYSGINEGAKKLYKIDLTNADKTAAPLINNIEVKGLKSESINLSDIKITSLISDNKEIVIIYGYNNNSTKYFSGKINLNGEIIDYIESDNDNSDVIVTSLSL